MQSFNEKLLRYLPKWFIGSLILVCLLSLVNNMPYMGHPGKYVNTLNDAGRLERLNPNLLLQQRQEELLKQENTTNSLKNVKILCWILTMPTNHDTKAIHVKNTWGKRCDKIIFMSSQYNETLPSIDLGYNETRNVLWRKTKSAYKYVYDHHLNSYNWFMKADDDTYVIMENLRYLLSSYHPDEDAIWFGSRFKPYNKQGYMSGGGGYVLSRQALRLFVEKSLPNPALCKEDDTFAEDAEMGKCLNNVGVVAGDSRDSEGRGRFFPFDPASHVEPNTVPYEWYTKYSYYDIKTGPGCCSDLAISFHYIPPKMMYELEYLIYNLHPFGIKHPDIYPPPLPKDRNSTTSRFLREYFAKAKGLHKLLEKYDAVSFIEKKINGSQVQTSTATASTVSVDAKTNETPHLTFATSNQAQEKESMATTTDFATSNLIDTMPPIYSYSIDTPTSVNAPITNDITPYATSNSIDTITPIYSNFTDTRISVNTPITNDITPSATSNAIDTMSPIYSNFTDTTSVNTPITNDITPSAISNSIDTMTTIYSNSTDTATSVNDITRSATSNSIDTMTSIYYNSTDTPTSVNTPITNDIASSSTSNSIETMTPIYSNSIDTTTSVNTPVTNDITFSANFNYSYTTTSVGDKTNFINNTNVDTIISNGTLINSNDSIVTHDESEITTFRSISNLAILTTANKNLLKSAENSLLIDNVTVPSVPVKIAEVAETLNLNDGKL